LYNNFQEQVGVHFFFTSTLGISILISHSSFLKLSTKLKIKAFFLLYKSCAYIINTLWIKQYVHLSAQSLKWGRAWLYYSTIILYSILSIIMPVVPIYYVYIYKHTIHKRYYISCCGGGSDLTVLTRTAHWWVKFADIV